MANSWQDAAKTVPVAADGDPIRVVEPEFGSGDTTAPNDAARPVIQNTAGDPDAVFDLVDDDLQVPVTTPGFLFVATKQGMYWGEYDFSVDQSLGVPGLNPRFPVVGWCAIDRVLTLAEIQGLKDYFAARGAVETISGNASSLLTGMTGWTTVGALDVSGVTALLFFAQSASSLTTIDVSNWDTSNVTDFSAFVRFASSLTTLDVSGWNTSNVTNFNGFARGASSLTALDVSNWDTSNVTDFQEFVRDASNLTTIDVSNWDTSSVTSFRSFAQFASSLTTVTVTGGTGNPFSDSPATNYTDAFTNTNLSQQSIDDILIAIDAAGTSNGTFNQSGGSAPSATGEAAVTSLRSRGWTVTVTGGF